jgi:hypothetical protein
MKSFWVIMQMELEFKDLQIVSSLQLLPSVWCEQWQLASCSVISI